MACLSSFRFLLKFAAVLATARQFYQIGPAIDPSATLSRYFHQWRRMIKSAPPHFTDQLFMTAPDVVRLDQLVIEKPLQTDAVSHRGDEHMQLNMFAQQVLAAHQAWVHHPHPHFNIVIGAGVSQRIEERRMKKSKRMTIRNQSFIS
jgi:hypothetical protein